MDPLSSSQSDYSPTLPRRGRVQEQQRRSGGGRRLPRRSDSYGEGHSLPADTPVRDRSPRRRSTRIEGVSRGPSKYEKFLKTDVQTFLDNSRKLLKQRKFDQFLDATTQFKEANKSFIRAACSQGFSSKKTRL